MSKEISPYEDLFEEFKRTFPGMEIEAWGAGKSNFAPYSPCLFIYPKGNNMELYVACSEGVWSYKRHFDIIVRERAKDPQHWVTNKNLM